MLNETAAPYAVSLKEILNDNHTSFKEADSLPLLPVFTGEGDDLRILYYKVDIMVYKADAAKDNGSLTPHEHDVSAEGHDHGTTAPE